MRLRRIYVLIFVEHHTRTLHVAGVTLNRSTAILLRSGFDHRAAAIVAVNRTGATSTRPPACGSGSENWTHS